MVPTAVHSPNFVALVTGLQELLTDEHSGSSQQAKVLFSAAPDYFSA